LRELLSMFAIIFMAELGDKTQLATLLFVAERKVSPLTVFAAAAAALVLAAGLSVLAGALAGKYLSQIPLKLIAGIGFVLLGGWSIADYFRG
jgi:putative Ca2+/H+ antiporter (TMEM165/GDT1 family)